jgi:tetratricopeptide (TPR) repeat protein
MNRSRLLRFTVLVVLLPAVMILTGCGGGVAGEGDGTFTLTQGTPVVRGNSLNDKGWELLTQGQPESAIAQFEKVLADSPTDTEGAEANNGLGWAHTKMGSLGDGMSWFEKAAPLCTDAKVGLAAAYIQRGSREDMSKVVDLLFSQVGAGNPHFHYTAVRPNGVSDAEAHAMLSYAYAALGQNEEALAQLDYAKELNPNWTGTTIDQIARVVDFLAR